MDRSSISMFALALGMCLSSPIYAQAAADVTSEPQTGGDQLEEILVTARRTKENLQSVPIAITALSADKLMTSNAREIRDVAILTPGLNIGGDGSERNQQPSIRGLSFTGNDTSEGNVAVMLDGIYMSNPSALSLAIFGFERVEVVKGPQSALYGHNAFAGAINYVTKAPPENLEAKVEGRIGNYDSHTIIASLGGALVEDVITTRLSGMYDKAGATYRDPVNDKTLGGYTKKNVALQFRVTPNDWAAFDISGYYGDDTFGRLMAASFANNCGANAFGTFTQYCGELPDGKDLLPLLAPNYEPPGAVGNDRIVKNVRIRSTFDVAGGAVVLNLGHFNVKTNSYQEFNLVRDGLPYQLVGSPAGTVTLPTFFGNNNSNKDYEAELRFTSDQSRPFRFAFGAYYYKINQTIITNIGVDSNPIPAGRSIVCPGGLACLWLSPGGVPIPNSGLAFSRNQQASFFGSAAYDFTDKLTITAEARYTDEKKFSDVVSVATAPPGPAQNPDGAGQTAKFKFTNPRFTLNYKISNDHFLYASAAKGTKAGGFNQRATLPEEQAFGPESNWSYEIGLKNTLFDNRVRLNVAAFYVDWSDLQISVPSRRITDVGGVIQNFGSVKAYGGEVELAARVTSGVDVNAGLAYTNPKFGSDAYDFTTIAPCRLIPSCVPRIVNDAPSAQGPTTAISLDGLTRIQVSKWQITAGTNIEKPLTDNWNWFASANYKYESGQLTQVAGIRSISARNNLSLQAGIANGKIRAHIYVINALDDLTPYAGEGGAGRTQFNTFLQVPRTSIPERRRIGLSVMYSY